MRPSESEIAPKALNDIGQLASGVGHNVINAFSAIVSNAELLKIKFATSNTPIDPAAIVDVIIETAMQASSVARRLIDYSRPITNIGEERVSLDRLVKDYVEARSRDETGGVAWSSDLAPVPEIKGQAGQLESMLDLLVANAREAMTPNGEKAIAFSTSVDSRGWVMLEIRDTGLGMSPRVLEQAVEPFFTTKPGRLGVGLSIAHGIWRRHKGTLSLRGQQGEGTTVRLCVEPCNP